MKIYNKQGPVNPKRLLASLHLDKIKIFALAKAYWWIFFNCWDEWDKPVRDAIRRLVKKGDVCIDIGANEGRMMKEMLKKCGPKGAVLAFEPLPDLCQKLRKRYKHHKNVGIYQNALSDESVVTLFYRDDHSGGSSFKREKVGELKEIISVSTTTLDAMNKQVMRLTRLDFVKMDVQYMELAVLRGMTNLIEQFHPIIIAECTEGSEDETAMMKFFQSYDYRITRYKDDILALKESN